VKPEKEKEKPVPTLAQTRNAVDARLADLWTNQIVPRQAAYAAAHGGRFWQGIVIADLDALPDNPTGTGEVAEVVPDLTRRAADHPSWQAANVNLGATVPMALAIHTYDGPQGRGYVGQVWVRHNGTTYTRAQNSGPEAWRTRPWGLA
jgi:hypothetical protein